MSNSNPTVLILGAGASQHVGYPVGSDLLSQICDLSSSSLLDSLPQGWTREYAEGFLTRLARAGYGSVDEFLEHNREFASLGKFLIAHELKKLEVLERLFPAKNSGWYGHLLNTLVPSFHDRPYIRDSGFGIITFNYDRSLEAYLHAAFQARFFLGAD